MRHPGLGAGLMVLAMLCFALMDTASKFLAEDYAITQIVWVRYLFFLGFAVLLCRRRGVIATLRTPRPWLQFGRAVLGVIEGAIFVVAFHFLPLAETHAVGAASPLLVVALSVPMLGERVGLRRWLAVLGGFAGVLIILQPGFGQLDLALLIPLFGALLWAIYQLLVRLCGRTDSAQTTLLWSAIGGVAVSSLAAPLSWTTPTASAWALMLGVACLGSVAHFAMTKALAFTEAAALQPFSYTLLVWVSALGWLVFGDTPAPATLLGGALVVACGLLAWWQERTEG
jgi:drug/metabolite transporter (DMT)-like permease